MNLPPSHIESLRQQIREHDHRYYVLNQPTLTDREYDLLFDELKRLEAEHPEWVTPDSPTQRVSETPIKGFTQVDHASPMLSIDNTYNEQELRDFDQRVRDGLEGAEYRYVVDPKIDGVAVSLVYEDGLLVRAVTRGNGRTGDDVTTNMRTLPTVPLRLAGKTPPRLLDVRGEVYWPDEPFTKYNEKRVEEGEEPFANPRNAAAGTLKQLDPRQVAGRGLQFVAHGFAGMEPPVGKTHWEVCQRLADWGLPVSEHRTVAADIDEVIKLTQVWHDKRFSLPYQTDGLVVKVDSLAQREILGATSRHPRWCIAYKFAPEQAETELLDVDFQVGKLGTITPRAVMKPVPLAGTTVRHASLHNFDQVQRLGQDHGGLHIGDIVLVEKAGEIIPQVIKIVRPGKPRGKAVVAPDACPVCSGEVEKDKGGVYLRCINPRCIAQLKERLRHFCARDQMDIEGVGEALIEQLVDQKLVADYADLYTLSKPENRTRVEKLVFLHERDSEGEKKTIRVEFGQKRTEQFLNGLEASKQRPLSRLLAALNIRHVGVRTAELLAAHFHEMENLRNAGEEKLMEVEGVGPELAASLRHFFTSKDGNDLINRLEKCGLNMSEPTTATTDGPFSGMTVVVTGTLPSMGRKEAQDLIKKLGGKPGDSVSKNTSLLVAGEAAGSKLDKAKKLGIEIIDESEFKRRAGL